MKIYIFFVLWLISFKSFSQNNYWKVSKESVEISEKSSENAFNGEFKVYDLDLDMLVKELSDDKIIKVIFPNHLGEFNTYEVSEKFNLNEKLARKYPNIKSYRGFNVNNKKDRIAFSISNKGMNTLILDGNDNIVIDKIKSQKYIVYKDASKAKVRDSEEFVSKHASLDSKKKLSSKFIASSGLIKLRLAILIPYAYTEMHGGTTESVLENLNGIINNVNAVSELDLNIVYEIVENNDKIIFLDSTSDPFKGEEIHNNGAEWGGNNTQEIINGFIGSENYDIGHLFVTKDETGENSEYGIGNAFSIGGVPQQIFYGAGWSRYSKNTTNKIGFVWLLLHEFGHQLGGWHTFTHTPDAIESQYEIGFGRSIMSYTNIYSNPYYHHNSIYNILYQFSLSREAEKNVGTLIPYDQEITITSLKEYNIPISTPFYLDLNENDLNPDFIYNWEQIYNLNDYEGYINGGREYWGGLNILNPLFVSLNPTTKPERFFPRQESIIKGELYKNIIPFGRDELYGANINFNWEALPEIGRKLKFGLSIRDNSNKRGVFLDTVSVNVVNETSAFSIKNDLSNKLFKGGEILEVSWEVGNTDKNPINTKYVKISMSNDGGLTFPFILSERAINDGLEKVIIPNFNTNKARIKIAALENIYFALNKNDFSIEATPLVLISSTTNPSIFTCQDYNLSFEIEQQIDSENNSSTYLSGENIPEGFDLNFSSSELTGNAKTTINIVVDSDVTGGKYPVTIKGLNNNNPYFLELVINVFTDKFDPITLEEPLNNSEIKTKATILKWEKNSNANSYIVQISKNPLFSSFVINDQVNFNEYSFKEFEDETTYYWRVSPVNDCANGEFSDSFKIETLFEIIETTSYDLIALNTELYLNESKEFEIEITDDNEIIDLEFGLDFSQHSSYVSKVEVISPKGESFLLGPVASKSTVFDDDLTGSYYLKSTLYQMPIESFEKIKGTIISGVWKIKIELIDDIFYISNEGKSVVLKNIFIKAFSKNEFKAPKSKSNIYTAFGITSTKIVLKANDYNGNELSQNFKITRLPLKGSLLDGNGNQIIIGQILNSSEINYKATGRFTGEDYFYFSVEHNGLSSREQIINLNTTESDRPITKSLPMWTSTQVNSILNIPLNVKNNYLPLGIRIENSTPNHGVVVFIDNQFIYTPNENFIGEDVFQYSIIDGSNRSTSTVNIQVFGSLKRGTLDPLNIIEKKDTDYQSTSYDNSFNTFSSSNNLPLNNDDQIKRGLFAGKTEVFERNLSNKSWEKKGEDINGEPGDLLGHAKLSGDGKRIILNTNHVPGYTNGGINDYVVVFEFNEDTKVWEQLGQKIIYDGFGNSGGYNELNTDINLDGNIIAIGNQRALSNGVPASGEVFTYSYNNDLKLWEQYGEKLIGSNVLGGAFGRNVKLDDSGQNLIVPEPWFELEPLRDPKLPPGKVFIYSYDGLKWVSKGEPLVGESGKDKFGYNDISINNDGNIIAIGASNQYDESESRKGPKGYAKVYYFDEVESSWKLKGQRLELIDELGTEGDGFGTFIEIDGKGEFVIVGSHPNFNWDEVNNAGGERINDFLIFYDYDDTSKQWVKKYIEEDLYLDPSVTSSKFMYHKILDLNLSNNGLSFSITGTPYGSLRYKNYESNSVTSEYSLSSNIIDSDNDGVLDIYDQCPNTTLGVNVDANGCEIFLLPANNFSVSVTSSTCVGSQNGSLSISAQNQEYSYTASISGQSSLILNASNNFEASISGLGAGNYDVCFTVAGVESYNQCFSVTVSEPAPLSTSAKIDLANRSVDLSLKGSTSYNILLNGAVIKTTASNLSLDLKPGMNYLSISTDLDCQGTYFEEIFVSEDVLAYPNPTDGMVQLYIGGSDDTVTLNIYDINSQNIISKSFEVSSSRVIEADISRFKTGIYFFVLDGKTIKTTHKIIKN